VLLPLLFVEELGRGPNGCQMLGDAVENELRYARHKIKTYSIGFLLSVRLDGSHRVLGLFRQMKVTFKLLSSTKEIVLAKRCLNSAVSEPHHKGVWCPGTPNS
jgi:hypothetical protein